MHALKLRAMPTVMASEGCTCQARHQTRPRSVSLAQVQDRAVLAGSKLLAGSRVARMFLFLYTVVLHFVILLLIWYATTPCPTAEPLALVAAGAAGGGEVPGVAAGRRALAGAAWGFRVWGHGLGAGAAQGLGGARGARVLR
jgi:homeobox protein cut-like